MANSDPDPSALTVLLNQASRGDEQARARVFPLLEQRLRRTAERFLSHRPPDPLIQPTALLDQALVDLVVRGERSWPSRQDFYRMTAKVMHDTLVDHARRENSRKRGGDLLRIAVEDLEQLARAEEGTVVLALDEALTALEELDSELAALARQRLLLRRSLAELALESGKSKSAIDRQWRVARTWLQDRLQEYDPGK